MTPEQRKNCLKWAEALRSGKYEQGKGCLKYKDDNGESYCCLGVACDISGLGEWRYCIVNKYCYKSHKFGNYSSINVPSSEISEYYGLGFGGFIVFNDYYGYSFEEIAYLIEEMVAKDMGLL